MKRSRGRGRRQQNPVNRSYDSNGPDVRVRGTASQVYEKYQALARDAMSAGDRVMAENYQQHAEHYFRILQSFQPQASDNNEAAAENANGVAEDAAAAIDGGAEANGQGADGAADNDAQAEANGSEPLVLVRDEGEDAAKPEGKSRRRGPLGKKRASTSTDNDEANHQAEAVGEDVAAPVEMTQSGDGDAPVSAE